jgi:hypothetical protein
MQSLTKVLSNVMDNKTDDDIRDDNYNGCDCNNINREVVLPRITAN